MEEVAFVDERWHVGVPPRDAVVVQSRAHGEAVPAEIDGRVSRSSKVDWAGFVASTEIQ